jgi:ketosteroid isomerase-like protein
MPKFLTLLTPFLPSSSQRRSSRRNIPLLVLLGELLATGSGLSSSRVWAETAESAPAELKATVAQVDAAANKRDLQGVLQFYSPNFANSDGLTRQSLEQALTQLWKRYPNLTYQTEVKSWKKQGNGFLVETSTRITGTQKQADREYKLDSTLRSQQQFENQKIVRQDILAEQSQITSGSNPPKVTLSLPDQVTVGEPFNFDAVVQEPLGSEILLGTALEEPVKPDGYLNPTVANLELLSAGGIFKVGRAPATPESRWLSAVLVRHDGTTMITKRLQVVGKK